MRRAIVRRSVIASIAPRCASSTSWVTRARSTPPAFWSFSLARPSFMARATSCAWVPSCRSRAIVAAEAVRYG
jgi:hypothetical protein